jgi:c-di-AMP phosphodiesterase-like protein
MLGGINMNKKRNKIFLNEEKVTNDVINNNTFGLIKYDNNPYVIFNDMAISEDYLKQKIMKCIEVLLEESIDQKLSDKQINGIKSFLYDLEKMEKRRKDFNKHNLNRYPYEQFKLCFPELIKYLGLK